MPIDDTILTRLNRIDQLVHKKTGQSLTNVQRLVLSECLQPSKTTYEAIAKQNNYSSSYIQQRVAPDIWYLMSEMIGTKVSKSNCRSVLFGYLDNQALNEATQLKPQAEPQSAAPQSTAPQSTTPQSTATQSTTPQSTAIQKSQEKASLLSQPTTAQGVVLEFPTESVPIGSPFYIQRELHELRCYQLIQQPGALIRIKAPRQMGKTSLMNRIITKAKDYPSIILNFQQTDQSIMQDLDKLLRWVSANITRHLKLPSVIDDFWDEDIGSKMSCTIYLEEYILEEVDTPIILVFEESSELFDHESVAKEFFGMLRTWYEYTKHNDAWKKLRLVLVQSTENYVQLNVNQSPFNVGFEVALKPFDRAQVNTLAERNGFPLTDAHCEQLMTLLAGHPYLVRLALYYLASGSIDWDQLMTSSVTDEGIFKHHLQRHLWQMQQHSSLFDAFKSVLSQDEPVQVEQSQGFKLQSMGLVTLEGNQVQVSCNLYRDYFREHLV